MNASWVDIEVWCRALFSSDRQLLHEMLGLVSWLQSSEFGSVPRFTSHRKLFFSTFTDYEAQVQAPLVWCELVSATEVDVAFQAPDGRIRARRRVHVAEAAYELASMLKLLQPG